MSSSQASQCGLLSLQVIEARLHRNTDADIDPYILIEHRGQHFKTTVYDEGGRNPVWNETFEIPVYSALDSFEIVMKDEDAPKVKDIVGQKSFKLHELCPPT